MLPVVSFLVVISLSLLVIRIASVALVHTGLSREAARFQARSAFTGVGFTTSESEKIVDHPVRRRVVMTLMLFGNVGIVTAMSALLLSFLVSQGGAQGPVRYPTLIVGVAALWGIGSSRWVDQRVCRVISWALNRFTSIDARDYARLLHVRDDYGVSELCVREGDWIAGRSVDKAHLSGEGLLVLGIECPGGSFIGAPPADTEIRVGDTLVLYGRTPRIAELDRRVHGMEGDASHGEAVSERDRIARAERGAAGR